MALDFSQEQFLTLTEAAASLPGKVHKNTLVRWHLKGVKGVHLETVMIGGRRYTSQESIQRFVERTTTAADGKPTPARTSRQRDLAVKQAEEELSSQGI